MNYQPFVYGLYDPAEVGHIRYVGMAPSVPTRPYQHAKRARKDVDDHSYLMHWIRKIQSEGREPEVTILEQLAEGTTRNFLGFVESCYVKSLRAIGHRLTNENDGGWGGSNGKHTSVTIAKMKAGWTPEARERVGAAAKIRNTGKRASEETRAKHRARFTPELRIKVGAEAKTRNTGLVRSDETKSLISAALTGKQKSETHRAKNSKAHVGKKHSLETRQQMSKSQKGNQNALGTKASAETRAKLSAAQKAAWAKRKGAIDG